MAKLAYYASLLSGKESQYQTPTEGYRIYLDVPICRTGSQEYFGRELKSNPGYDSIWGLQDDVKYEVFRPLEEVTARETIASFEGKSVLDEHPHDKVLVDAIDEFDGVSKGHGQNIRVGTVLEDGETPLIADLHVKHPELNIKIDNGIREVSCGYTFVLAKDDAGRLIMTKIRGNHIAVVPRGRAGPEVAIGDAAPQDAETQHQSQETRKATMSFSSKLMRAIGFQNWAKDAKPEEVAAALDAMEEEAKTEAAADAEEHVKGCRCDDCMPGMKDKKGAKDKGAKDAEAEKEKAEAEKAAKDAKEAEEKAAMDAAEEEERKKKEEEEKKATGDEAEVIAPEDRGKSEFSAADAISLLDEMRTVIARGKNTAATNAYNKLTENMRKVRDGVKDGSLEDPFVSLVNIGAVADAAAAEDEPSIMSFFNGKTHQEGLKAWNDHLASKGAK